MDEVKEELSRKDVRREEVIALTREIRRASTQAIREMHRGNFDAAREWIDLAKRKLFGLEPGDYEFSLLQEAVQEYAEAELTRSFLKGEEPPAPRDINIPREWYVLGLADAVGELRRYILELIRQDRYSDIGYFLELMEDITYEILALDYPPAVINIKRKQDIAKMLLERTMSDIVRAEKDRELIKRLEKLAGER